MQFIHSTADSHEFLLILVVWHRQRHEYYNWKIDNTASELQISRLRILTLSANSLQFTELKISLRNSNGTRIDSLATHERAEARYLVVRRDSDILFRLRLRVRLVRVRRNSSRCEFTPEIRVCNVLYSWVDCNASACD